MLKSDLCDYSIIGHNVTQVPFKSCAFIKCTTKIDGTTTDDAEDLNFVMPMCNLLEYCLNYSDMTGSFWFYSKDEATNFNADFAKGDAFKSFKYKTKASGNTVADGQTES